LIVLWPRWVGRSLTWLSQMHWSSVTVSGIVSKHLLICLAWVVIFAVYGVCGTNRTLACRQSSAGLLIGCWPYFTPCPSRPWGFAQTWTTRLGKEKYLRFTVAIQAALRKITEYYDKTADSDASTLTMGLFKLASLHWYVITESLCQYLIPVRRCTISRNIGLMICRTMSRVTLRNGYVIMKLQRKTLLSLFDS
jgi:hypothetical protein